MNTPIGIFDSGMGGLTVAKAVTDFLPYERIIYFGDTAHFPYGDKSAASLKNYSRQISRFLLDQGCKVILIACNSAASAAYEEVKNLAGNGATVINVIDPVVEYVAQKYDGKKVGLIGTKRTIASNTYYLKLQEANPSVHLQSLATPLFAPMIEEGFANSQVSKDVIKSYLQDKRAQDIDALILGCTHYPLIKDEITTFYKNQVEIIDSSEIIANVLKNVLASQSQLCEEVDGDHHFYISDYTKEFEKSTRVFFGKQVSLEPKDIYKN